MRYMLIRKADAGTERGEMPANEVLSAMADYNQQMLEAGVFVSGNGLRPSAEGHRLHIQANDVQIEKGPFDQTDTLLAGYTIIDVQSPQDAIDWASQWPKEDAEAQIELRRFYELSDFQPGSGLDKHLKMDDQMRRQPASMASYLIFAGDCREAMTFYADLLGGDIEFMQTFSDSPLNEEVPAEWRSKVLHARLNIAGRILMGSDAMPHQYEAQQGMSVQIGYPSVIRAKTVFDTLAESGEIQMPFTKTFWSDGFGMVKDRFGTPWIINAEGE